MVVFYYWVLIVDDLIVMGGIVKVIVELLIKFGCEVLGFVFIIEFVVFNGC